MSSVPVDPWPWPPPPPPPRGLRGLWQRRRGLLLGSAFGAVALIGALLGWLTLGQPGELPDGAPRPSGTAASGGAAYPGGPGPGTLLVTTLPSGATVLLDNRFVGRTPLRLDDLPPRACTLTLAADGYAPFDTVVTPDPLQSSSVFVVLRSRHATPSAATPPPVAAPAPPLAATPSTAASPGAPAGNPTGTLHVRVDPWGTILIDGTLRARETDVRHEETLPVGRHVVRAVHPALGEREVPVVIRAGATTNLVIDLNRTAPPE